MRRLFTVLLAVLVGLLVYGALVRAGVLPDPGRAMLGDLDEVRSDAPGTRVLFVGNSLTNNNGMPSLVRSLAAADEHRPAVFVVEYTRNGSNLRRLSDDAELASLLNDVPWDHVVLQEQSQLQSFPAHQRQVETDPYARQLHLAARSAGAETTLFLTWGYRDGDDRNAPGDTYVAMQRRLTNGYSALAQQLPARIAPVGLAWAEALRRRPGLDLWAEDGRHPNLAGSYLAACVFYRVLLDRNPRGNPFTAGLDADIAAFLQDVAASATAGDAR